MEYINLDKELLILQEKYFYIMDNYIKQKVRKSDIDDFEKYLLALKDKISKVNVNEENLLQIAKLKSKIQHYYTEVLEDEDVLTIAYRNEV